MRPVAPKRRKKDFVRTDSIYLETIKFYLESNDAETSSATRRDSFMTIFGIGGCMALLLLGFGIKDSISAISEKQYGEIITYVISRSHTKDRISETKKI